MSDSKCVICSKKTSIKDSNLGLDKSIYCNSCFNSDDYTLQVCKNLAVENNIETKALILKLLESQEGTELLTFKKDFITSLTASEIDQINKINNNEIWDHSITFNEYYTREYAKKLFNSQSFITTFRESLPQGKDDQEFGIDHIPFLLKNIEIKKKRLENNASIFLKATIALGLTFTLILVGFGIVLIDESTIGDKKRINQIENHLAYLEDQYDSFSDTSRNIVESTPFKDKILIPIREIQDKLSSYEDSLTWLNQINSAITIVKERNDISHLGNPISNLRANLTNIIDSNEHPKMYTEINDKVRTLERELRIIQRSRKEVFSRLKNIQDNVNILAPEVRKHLENTDVELAEMLKRISIGVIIAGFFLTVLRYTANLYQTHLNEVISTESEEFHIRKFYIALKVTQKDKELEKDFIYKALYGEDYTYTPSLDLTKQNFESHEMFKDLITSMTAFFNSKGNKK